MPAGRQAGRAPGALPRRLVLPAGLAAFLAGCAPPAGIRRGAGGADILAAEGRPPTVVFENGLGATLGSWTRVIAALPPGTAYFTYDRPGYGRSPAGTTRRDGATIVAELRALLAAEGIRPPWILVGHSFGGLTMQLFARAHPAETAALILVDSTHPRQLECDGALERQAWWVRAVLGIYARGTAADELALIPETGRQVLALPPPAGVPVWVLSAERPMREQGSAVARWANALRADLAQLHPGARQVWVDSGHDMPREKPDAIVAAITEALAAARTR